MRFYDVSFFCDEGNYPKVHISNLRQESDESIVVRINPTGISYDKPGITFHLGPQDLINFKNSFLHAFESYRRNPNE